MRVRWGGGVMGILLAFAAGSARAADYQPDDTGDVAAIQNRTYHMAQEIDFALAVLPYDAFYKGIAPEAAYTFHFTDALGWEAARFGYSFNSQTNLAGQLHSDGLNYTPTPQVKLFLSSDVVWSPVYVKGAFVNHYILYGEVYGLLGGAAFLTNNANNQTWAPAGDVGLGGRLFLTRAISIKLELRENLFLDGTWLNVVDINLGLGINFGASD